MKLEKICELTRKTAEAEETKQESRTKLCYFTRTENEFFRVGVLHSPSW